MPGIATEVTRRIAAPIEDVWTVITDIGAYPGRVASYRQVEFVTVERAGLGASWRQTRSVFGREHAQVLRIVGWEPPRSLVTTARESGAAYTTTYRLTEVDGSTEVVMRFDVASTSVVGALFQRLIGGRLIASTREAMERDLADLAAVAEG